LIDEISNLLPIELYGGDERSRRFEARLIAEKLTGLDYSNLVSQQLQLDSEQNAELVQIVNSRASGKPLAYILNLAYFRNLELYVDERVLIPRSETELLVDEVLARIKNVESPRVLEIGVGSGAISISLAQEYPQVSIVGTDISKGAVEVASLNATRLLHNQVPPLFLQGNLYEPIDVSLKNSFDVIVSNPPYIGADEKPSLSKQVLDFEPHSALFAPDNGFELYGKILEDSRTWLKAGGCVLFEIAPRHVEKMNQYADQLSFRGVTISKDLAGRDRIAQIEV